MAISKIVQDSLNGGVAGNGPAFSASANNTTSCSNGSATKVAFDTKDFDTATCFNNTNSTVTLNGLSVPAYSFCPNVAGYYQVSSILCSTATNTAYIAPEIYKNGSYYRWIGGGAASSNYLIGAGSMLIYLNGTGDYISLYCYAGGATFSVGGATQYNYFSASLVRGA